MHLVCPHRLCTFSNDQLDTVFAPAVMLAGLAYESLLLFQMTWLQCFQPYACMVHNVSNGSAQDLRKVHNLAPKRSHL